MPSPHGVSRCVSHVVLAFALAASASAVALSQSGTAQSGTTQRDAVRRALAGEDDFRNIDVSVDDDGRVLLTGDLPVLLVKMRAIERALEAVGGQEIVSELAVPEAESDEALAEAVAESVQYTIFDYISASIEDGTVVLWGKVTAVPDKVADLTERVARVRGVQNIENQIEVMTPSRADDELRARLARRIFGHPSFQRYGSMPNPPFHVVVHNGIVTLVGYVQSQIEMLEIQQLVGFTQGILRVDNQLETLR